MIDKNDPRLKEALKHRTKRGIDGTFEALNAIKLVEIMSQGKRTWTHINGHEKNKHYKKFAQKYWTEWKGKMYPMTTTTIHNTVNVIFKTLNFSFETFDKFYPKVEVRHVEIPLTSKSKADPINKEKIRLRKQIRDNVGFLSVQDLKGVLSLIIQKRESKTDV